jgi:hypothetical protein
MAATKKEISMPRSAVFAMEFATQIALAAAIGLFVSVLLAGVALLLAA